MVKERKKYPEEQLLERQKTDIKSENGAKATPVTEGQNQRGVVASQFQDGGGLGGQARILKQEL